MRAAHEAQATGVASGHDASRPARASTATTPALHVLRLQAAAGNRAVTRALGAGQSPHSGAGPSRGQGATQARDPGASVQRCGGEVHAGCSCADEAQDASEAPVQRLDTAEAQRLDTAAVQRFTDGTPEAPSADLPDGSPYAGLPPELLAMLGRTVVAKTYWKFVNNRATNLGMALDGEDPANINTLVQLCTELVRVGLWSHVQTMKTVWSGSSLGIDYNGSDMGADADRNPSFCKDTAVGEIMHSGASCWREMVTPGTPGLHVCMPGSVHIDPHQTVETEQGTGWSFGGDWGIELMPRCKYAALSWFGHMADVVGGRSVNVFTRANDDRQKIRDARVGLGHDAAHLSQLDALDARLDALEPILRRWSISGLEGTDAPAGELTRVQDELAAIETATTQVEADTTTPLGGI